MSQVYFPRIILPLHFSSLPKNPRIGAWSGGARERLVGRMGRDASLGKGWLLAEARRVREPYVSAPFPPLAPPGNSSERRVEWTKKNKKKTKKTSSSTHATLLPFAYFCFVFVCVFSLFPPMCHAPIPVSPSRSRPICHTPMLYSSPCATHAPSCPSIARHMLFFRPFPALPNPPAPPPPPEQCASRPRPSAPSSPSSRWPRGGRLSRARAALRTLAADAPRRVQTVSQFDSITPQLPPIYRPINTCRGCPAAPIHCQLPPN